MPGKVGKPAATMIFHVQWHAGSALSVSGSFFVTHIKYWYGCNHWVSATWVRIPTKLRFRIRCQSEQPKYPLQQSRISREAWLDTKGKWPPNAKLLTVNRHTLRLLHWCYLTGDYSQFEADCSQFEANHRRSEVNDCIPGEYLKSANRMLNSVRPFRGLLTIFNPVLLVLPNCAVMSDSTIHQHLKMRHRCI